MVQKNLAGWQTTQRDKKNKEITSFKKLKSFLFKVPFRRSGPSNKVLFVPCDNILLRARHLHHHRSPSAAHLRSHTKNMTAKQVQSNPVHVGAIQSARINGVFVLRGLNLEKM